MSPAVGVTVGGAGSGFRNKADGATTAAVGVTVSAEERDVGDAFVCAAADVPVVDPAATVTAATPLVTGTAVVDGAAAGVNDPRGLDAVVLDAREKGLREGEGALTSTARTAAATALTTGTAGAVLPVVADVGRAADAAGAVAGVAVDNPAADREVGVGGNAFAKPLPVMGVGADFGSTDAARTGTADTTGAVRVDC